MTELTGLLPWLQVFGPAAGMAALLFILQARGHLVPKRLHDEVRLDRDTYRKAAETAMQANTQITVNMEKLIDVTATVVNNSEKQLVQGDRILHLVERLVPAAPSPIDRSAA